MHEEGIYIYKSHNSAEKKDIKMHLDNDNSIEKRGSIA